MRILRKPICLVLLFGQAALGAIAPSWAQVPGEIPTAETGPVIESVPPGSAAVDQQLPATRRPSLNAFYITSFLAVGAGVAALVYANQGNDYYRQYERQTTMAGAQDYWDRTATADRMRNVALVACGASAAAALYLRLRYSRDMRDYGPSGGRSRSFGQVLPVRTGWGTGVAVCCRF